MRALRASTARSRTDANGNADCELGQRGFPRQLIPDRADKSFQIAVTPDTPGNQGGVFDHFDKNGEPVGILTDRIPQGQTFAWKPETTPYTWKAK